MPSIESMIANMYALKDRGVKYSMTFRNGPDSYDCSSSVYYSLIAGGFLPQGHYIGNTESLFNDLPKAGFERHNVVDSFATQRGDIFIWGQQGASAGAAGHTGIFIDADNIINCNFGYNGVVVNNHDWLFNINHQTSLTIFRYTSATSQATPAVVNNPTDQSLEIGSVIKFDKTYTVDDVQVIGGVWQVRCNELCHSGFTWDDNGIPAEPLVEVDAEGYATIDQELDIGSRFVLPGKFTVLDIGHTSDMWLAEVEISGMKCWLDVATATEITPAESGTAVPATKRVEQATPVTTAPAPTPIPESVEKPATPPANDDDKNVDTPVVVTTPKPVEKVNYNIPKEIPMTINLGLTPKARAVIYVIVTVGSFLMTYLVSKGYVGDAESALWTAISGFATLLALGNTPVSDAAAADSKVE